MCGLILSLDETEARALLVTLENYLPQLAEDAARIERGREAHPVWERYRVLESIRDRMRAAQPEAAPSP